MNIHVYMHTDNTLFTLCKIKALLRRKILTYAFNRKTCVNTGKLATKRGQSKLSLGILDKTQKQTYMEYRLLWAKVNQKKTSRGREKLRQLISSLITWKAIPKQMIQIPMEFARLANTTNGQNTFQFTAWVIWLRTQRGKNVVFLRLWHNSLWHQIRPQKQYFCRWSKEE